jgi:hypothetical protein
VRAPVHPACHLPPGGGRRHRRVARYASLACVRIKALISFLFLPRLLCPLGTATGVQRLPPPGAARVLANYRPCSPALACYSTMLGMRKMAGAQSATGAAALQSPSTLLPGRARQRAATRAAAMPSKSYSGRPSSGEHRLTRPFCGAVRRGSVSAAPAAPHCAAQRRVIAAPLWLPRRVSPHPETASPWPRSCQGPQRPWPTAAARERRETGAAACVRPLGLRDQGPKVSRETLEGHLRI